VVASLAASVSYLALGLVLLAMAGGKCKEIIDHHRRMLAEADRRLAQEDEDAALDRQRAAEAALSELERPAGAEQAPAEEGDAAWGTEIGTTKDQLAPAPALEPDEAPPEPDP
jgi:hypothetical protein